MIGPARGRERDEFAQRFEAHQAKNGYRQRRAEERHQQQRVEDPPHAHAAVERGEGGRVEAQLRLALHDLADRGCRSQQRDDHRRQ